MHAKAAGTHPAAGTGKFTWLMQRVGPHGSLLLGLSAVLLVWLGAFHFIQKEYQQTEQAALQNSGNLARAFEEQLIRSIRAADQTIRYARDSYARNPRNFDISLWSRNSQFLSDFAFQVAVIDRDGLMVTSNLDPGAQRVDLGDREHFRVHVGRETDELFISKPVFGRVSGKWSVQLTRRVTMLDGSFGGVVVVSLDPEYLASFYQSINLGENGSVAVVGMDGVVRARGARRNGDSIGASIAGGALFDNLARADSGFYSSESQLDQVERLFAYRKVADYPLAVVVGLARDEVFEQFANDRRTYLLAATLLTFWLLLVTSVMSRYQRGLARTRDLAQAGTRARSEFLAMMSHEIRTPMNGVVGMADLLLDSPLDEEQAQLAATLKDSAEHLLQIINDVLDFSKLEAERVEIEQIPFDVERVVRGTVAILEPRAREKNLELRVEIAPDVPARVNGDPARLRQVLLNLIGNGVKFTRVGGVTVKVERAAEFGRGADVLAFTVVDTGIGVPPDARKLLFREFSQLDSSISRRFGGTGLGLAICKRLVDLMGGGISVESEQGKGSSFRFTAKFHQGVAEPLDDGDGAEAAGTDAGTGGSPGAIFAERGLRVLLAEDNPTNQIVAIKMLKSLGLAADVVANGVDAFTACSETRYDLILMDIMMPEMDGIAATNAIRRLPRPNCDAWVVALTGNALRGDEETCRQAGMNDFLAKPFVKDDLRLKLERFLASAPGIATPKIPAHAATAAAAVPPASTSSEPVFDKSIYDELADAIGAEDTRAVFSTFMHDTRNRLATMAILALRAERAAVVRDAHAIKSSAASLGLLALSARAKRLEQGGRDLPSPALYACVAELSATFEKSINETRELLEPSAPLALAS